MKNPMRCVTLLVVVLAVTPLTNIHAQDSLPVTVGTRVRVTAPTLDLDKYDGTLQALTRDTLTVDTLRIAVVSVMKLDVYRGHATGIRSSAACGAAAGFLVGSFVGWCNGKMREANAATQLPRY